MKKFFISFILTVVSVLFVSAESYRINEVSYDISGLTREYALEQKVPIDTKTIFHDEESFNKYISNLEQVLNNQRVFQSTSVTLTYLDKDVTDVIPVDILITTVDTLNIIGVPYPSYNSNTGLTLKIKVKDYNFLGSMETMTFDLNYKAQGADTSDDIKHIFGINFGFSIPFQFYSLPASWNNDLSFSYTIGNSQLDMSIREGIGFAIPVYDITSVCLSFDQYYIQDSDYKAYGDDKYFKEKISLSLPFTIYTLPNLAKITWTPSTSFSVNWDGDMFKGDPYGGLASQKLRGPVLSFGHAFSTSHINWMGNYRDGFSASLGQNYEYNLNSESDSMSVTFNSEYHKKLCSFIGLSSREIWYKNFSNKPDEFGSLVRGVRDYDWDSEEYLLLNLDLPVKLFQTDWPGLFGWDKLHIIDFEFQFSPFIDIVLGDNEYAGSSYNLKDGWYGAGCEMIVYPDRFRSIQGRISFGVDAVQFLQKVGNKVSTFDGLAESMFNTGWRSGASSWYELSIGIGLFY